MSVPLNMGHSDVTDVGFPRVRTSSEHLGTGVRAVRAQTIDGDSTGNFNNTEYE